MEDLPFKPSYDMEKVSNAFISPNLTFSNHLDHSKPSFKLDNLASPLQVNPNFRRRRLSSYEAPTFHPFKEDESYFQELPDHVKVESFNHEYQNFLHQGQMDPNFELPLALKPQDYTVDYYRINRSRGPSFNLGPGRKNSEDLFAHGFDLLSYCSRNVDPTEKLTMQEQSHDARMHHSFMDDFRNAPLMPHVLPGGFASMLENNFQYPIQGTIESAMTRDSMGQVSQAGKQRPIPTEEESQQNVVRESEFEPKDKKKKKNNNAVEVSVQNNEKSSAPQLKKGKSEKLDKKATKDLEPPSPIKNSKSTIGKPSAKKAAAPKAKKQNSMAVKSEVEDRGDKEEKSTEAPSSINVSPNPKKEDLPPHLMKSKSSIVGTFGTFRKPETAQELLGGMSLPAEVEEYINKSKLFNQIKAPIVRKIGTLTLEERRVKIEKYLEKRKRRTWSKRVNYDCRKKVADNRLRIKGRFVTKDQAFGMLEALGIYPDPEKISNNEIKELLSERFGALPISKKKDTEGEEGKNQGKSKKNVKMDMNKKGGNQNVEPDGENDTSSFGSQDDSISETYM